MKIILTTLILLSCFFGFSQKHEHKIDTVLKVYIPLKEYKQKYTEFLTKEDSLKFKFKENDTLILVDNYIPKGVYVPYEVKDSIFLKYYKKIAFNHDKGVFSYDTRMKHWKGDIKIYFPQSVSKKIQKKMMTFANEISSNIDSLNIYKVKDLEDSNYVIYYGGGYDFETKMSTNKNSDYYIWWRNHSNQIYKGSIRLQLKRLFNDDLKIMKMKELFLKSLGHFNFISEFECNNYFADCNAENKSFSKLDFEVLKYHYSYGICKGTDLITFEEQHIKAKQILKDKNAHMNFVHVN